MNSTTLLQPKAYRRYMEGKAMAPEVERLFTMTPDDHDMKELLRTALQKHKNLKPVDDRKIIVPMASDIKELQRPQVGGSKVGGSKVGKEEQPLVKAAVEVVPKKLQDFLEDDSCLKKLYGIL